MTEIELVPAGYRLVFVFIALAKRALLSPGIKPAAKLSFLEMLDALPDQYIRPEMVAMVEPMCDTAYAIYREAKSLDPPADKTASSSFSVLSSEKVFRHFLTLNPSILKAIEWREANLSRAAVASAATPAAVPDAVPPPTPPTAARPPYAYDIPDRFLQGGPAR